MRATLLAVAALAFLRIVLGLHFFLEGFSHLRDPAWSSAGFRKAAVGPLGDFYRSTLPQTGDWSGTLGAVDGPAVGRSVGEAAQAWRESVVATWQGLLDRRLKAVPLDAAGREAAAGRLAAASRDLEAYLASIEDDLADYRLEVTRLAATKARPETEQIPFERERVVKKRNTLAAQANGWMADAAAIGNRLVSEWDAQLPSDAARRRSATAAEPSSLWKADRFVSWSLTTIGACLVLGLFVKFNAMGAAIFLASVVATQPFWVVGAQPTYNQWVELAALLAIAALPTGGWSGLDYFLSSWCPLAACRRRARATP
jgi:uncharacterized membrane protein YphA (DoxX/SURF4 family)